MLSSALRVPAFRPAVASRRLTLAPAGAPMVQRGALVVMAADADKEKAKKKMPSPVKRAELNEERRARNRQIKSACATRIKKALKAADALLVNLPKAESELKDLDKLIGEANKELDKARSKGVIHVNTGGRRKARLSRRRTKVLVAAGLYTPAKAE